MEIRDTVTDLEHRDLVRVARNPGRRAGHLDRLDIGVGSHELLALKADPGGTRTRLAVGQRKHHVAEQLRSGAKRGVGRVGRKASDQQQIGCSSRRQRSSPSLRVRL